MTVSQPSNKRKKLGFHPANESWLTPPCLPTLRGSAMLVGVGGSGKQSLTHFAAFISDTQCSSIELVRNYGLNEFREDIKKMFK